MICDIFGFGYKIVSISCYLITHNTTKKTKKMFLLQKTHKFRTMAPELNSAIFRHIPRLDSQTRAVQFKRPPLFSLFSPSYGFIKAPHPRFNTKFWMYIPVSVDSSSLIHRADGNFIMLYRSARGRMETLFPGYQSFVFGEGATRGALGASRQYEKTH